MGTARDVAEAVWEYARHARRDWHETPPITKRDEHVLNSTKEK